MTDEKRLQIIKKYHDKKITILGGSTRFAGWYQTYFGSGSDRKQRRFRSLTELYEYCVYYYGNRRETLETLFPRWLKWKGERNGNKARTLESNRIAYDKYVCGTRLERIPLVDITADDLNNWAREVLLRKPLNASRFNTYKIVVTGPLDLAVREGIIEKTPWDPAKMDYKPLLRARRRAPSGKKIFYDDEIQAIITACRAGHLMTHSSTNIAIMVNFDLGLRVGELSALKWSDIDWKSRTVFIQRQESEGKVEDYVKSDSACGYRELPLSSGACTLLQQLRGTYPPGTEWVFANADGTRKTARSIQQRLIHIQEHLDMVPVKRIHCQRRTVGTRIARARGLEAARQWLGHTDLQTTLRYVYTTETAESMASYADEASVL